MVKLASREILDLLRRYELADANNVPKNIENIKITHTTPTNTLVSFVFLKHPFYILFDDTAEDDIEAVLGQVKTPQGQIKSELIKNPKESSITTYAMPFHGKDCYLCEVISDKKRLDIELASRYPESSRSTWQKYIKAGFVSVNDRLVDSPKFEVAKDDNIQVNMPDAPDYSDNSLPIIYIDDNVIVINKPAGILTHAKGAICDEFTVADFFRRYTTYNLDTNRPGIVHRLDRDTSGVIIGARNDETAAQLQKQFADRKSKKTYFAIVKGLPKHIKANIDLPISRNPSAPSTFRVDAGGKSSQTSYEVIDSNDKYSLVKLQPTTGRTHQLRVHMAYINSPILGDKIYGKPAERLYLHAFSLEITIPNGQRQTFVAPLPDEFCKLFPKAKI